MTETQQVNLTEAEQIRPEQAPVGEPLSEKEKAGVYLTWGVLAMVTVFVVFALIFVWRRESGTDAAIGTLGQASALDTLRFRLIATERSSFREFWLKLVQMILVNVLLPVLTALLGYVFGTHGRGARQDT